MSLVQTLGSVVTPTNPVPRWLRGGSDDDEAAGSEPQEGGTDDETNRPIFGFDFQGEEQSNPLLVGPIRDAYDLTFDYDERLNGERDRHDVVGPTLGSVGDALVDTRGEETDAGERQSRWILLGAAGLVVLWLLGPVFELVAALAGGE